MFHRKAQVEETSTTSSNAQNNSNTQNNSTRKHNWFGRNRQNNVNNNGNNFGNAQNGNAQYYGSTRSDWDHYAVRHDDALIGDPIPIIEPGKVGAFNNANGVNSSGFDNGMNNGINNTNGLNGVSNRFGTAAPGPVVSTEAIKGNYSSGTVVERQFNRTGPNFAYGYNHPDGLNADRGIHDSGLYEDRSSFGNRWNEPLYGASRGGWGNEPLVPRDFRDTNTPLLPDNPWTHNELGREYRDAYKSGTLVNKSIDKPITIVETEVAETVTTLPTNSNGLNAPLSGGLMGQTIPIQEAYMVPTTSQQVILPQSNLQNQQGFQGQNNLGNQQNNLQGQNLQNQQAMPSQQTYVSETKTEPMVFNNGSLNSTRPL